MREDRDRVPGSIDLHVQRRVCNGYLGQGSLPQRPDSVRFATPTSPEEDRPAVLEIEVSRTDVEQFLSRFLVRVTDDDGTTSHVVTLSRTDHERLGRNHRSPEAFVEACFRFLLEREPKEQIMGSFDVSQIGSFFPEFEAAIDRARD